MKIRKNVVAWIGIILCVAIAGIVLAIPTANNLFALLPAALFIPFVITLSKADNKKVEEEEDEEGNPKMKINWPLFICWTLLALATITTIVILFVFGWWFLLPLVILFGLLIWLAYLLQWRTFWYVLFAVCMAIAIVLLGVFGIVESRGGVGSSEHIDTLYVDNLIVDEATMATVYVAEEEVDHQKVTEQEVDMQKTENSQVTNQTVTNQNVTNQVTENETVQNQVVENQTVVKPTEPAPTEPKPTEPAPTEPKPTEPKPTEPVHEHSYTSTVTAPTCTAQGYTTYTCACGHSYKDTYKGALGHSYKSTVVEPTTSAGGYTEHKCERCGHTYKDNFTDKLPEPTEPAVVPAIKCANTIRYGETVYVNLEGISASNLKVSNKAFVSVEIISDSRVAITLTEDVTGYITITDSASGTNVVIDIAE